MREIKFRGKTICTNEWVYGNLSSADMDTVINNLKIVEPTLQDPCEDVIREYYQVIPETVCQFIVNEDGFQIYEKDIIDEYQGDVFIRRFVASNIRSFITEYDKSNHSSTWKVVGNTIDNPEMLESK